eukprot:TRINITY_DN8751_c0_g2_i3.p1 TRINITY_DN8751_c0_g2~~TRINITY_DN8751_c0_g2_i3.p1  ORF type:complete len:250 (-),score=58.40 TRINITY_DN8751_c0_g2_i3:484-1233(-)
MEFVDNMEAVVSTQSTGIPANSFLLNNMQRCNDFLDLISVEPERGIIPRLCSVRDAISVEIPELLKYLLNTDSTEKVYKKLAVSPENSTLERFREIMENYSKDYVVTSVHEEKPYSFRGSKLSNTKYVVLFKKLMSEETVATKKIIEAYRSANKCKNHAISRDEWISICGALLESLSLSPEVQRHKVTSSTDPQMMEFVDNISRCVISTKMEPSVSRNFIPIFINLPHVNLFLMSYSGLLRIERMRQNY